MCKVLGMGIDLCQVSRMQELLSDGRFLARYFTETEAAYICGKGASAAQTMAGIYAAKEAALKALGTGLTVSLRDVEITHTELGAPLCCLTGEAARLYPGNYQVSITHEGGMAAAVCLRTA